MNWVFQSHIPEIASMVGLGVGVVGFGITFYGVWKSNNAAQAAKIAAESGRDAAVRSAAIVDLSAVVAIMDEIKQHHRAKSWHVLPEKYSGLRSMLIAIKTSHPDLSRADRTAIQGAIGQFSAFEEVVERALDGSGDPPMVPQFNRVVSKQVDNLNEILERFQRELGS